MYTLEKITLLILQKVLKIKLFLKLYKMKDKVK